MSEEINMFSYFTILWKQDSSYNNNKGKLVGSKNISKSPKPIVEIFWELQVNNTIYLIYSILCDKGDIVVIPIYARSLHLWSKIYFLPIKDF